MERETLVFIARVDGPVPVGRLWTRSRGASETASFEYDAAWLDRPDAFGVDPVLPLARGPFHTALPLFNAFTDPAPDRWGQMLMRRHERRQAEVEGRTPRALLAIDFLLRVHDEARLGALRFKDPAGSDFLASTGPAVPPLLDLPRLLAATTRILDNRETEEDLRLVLAPGSSLGGARPKASLLDRDGHLLIAKFPRADDEWSVTRWEATTMELARAAGVDVAPWRLETVSGRPVFMARRFDRSADGRIPYLSALTALVAADNEQRSYIELAEFLRREGSNVTEDLAQLWRRVVFNMHVSNVDDHLRNHAFLREPNGWRLAPAFDLNPVPLDVRLRIHSLSIDEVDAGASLDTALRTAPAFGLQGDRPRAIVDEVTTAVSCWRTIAARYDIASAEVDRMASAFTPIAPARNLSHGRGAEVSF